LFGRLSIQRSQRIGTCRAGAALLAVSLAAGAAQAQQPRSCTDGRITNVFIDNHSVFDLADVALDDRFRWAYRLTNRMHVRTRPEVIARELLFAPGDCYDPELLRESERVLRAARFIADVDVYGIRQADESYHVIVDTRDEWSFRLEPQLGRDDGQGVVGLRLGDDNLMGTGRQLSVFFLRRYEEPVYGFSYATPQLFGTRWDAGLAYSRNAVGHVAVQTVTYPFVGESGRWAFREELRLEDRHFEFHVREGERLVTVLLPEQRASLDLGFVRRRGERGRLTLFGGGIAGERVRYPSAPVRVFADGRYIGPTPAIDTVGLRGDTISNVRALVLLGQRNIHFVRRHTLDTVNGTEDVRLGAEVEAVIGHTLPKLSTDRGLSLDFGLFAAAEPADGLHLGLRFSSEMRRDIDRGADASEWSDVLVQADSWVYWKPEAESRHTVVASAGLSGGWFTRVPYQLTLGGAAGLRGYRRHVDPGAQRVVASVEHRAFLGWPLPRLFDLGSVAFVDAGRVWAGDAPFADGSHFRASAGVGLRAAFPPGSRQTARMDVAVPLDGRVGWRDVLVRVGVGQPFGPRIARYDPQLRRSSRRGLTASVFNFPN
jgi:hypothetical protein